METRRPLRVGGREGVVLPAHAVSAGKALLAALPVNVLRGLYAEEELAVLTERTLRTRTALEAQLVVAQAVCACAERLGRGLDAVSA